MLFQTILNIFGSVDLLPLTGVTMMFVSRGGTSLIAAFLLLSFIKAAEVYPQRLETERRRYY
jgi:cell division protein FtsW (lipid II flippase)